MRFGEPVIQFQGVQGGGTRIGDRAGLENSFIIREEGVTICQLRPGRSVTRVVDGGLLEESDRLVEILDRSLGEEILSFQVQIVGSNLLRRHGGAGTGLFRLAIAQGEFDLIPDLLRDFRLHRQQVFQFAVIFARPEMCLITNVDQLSGDADTPAFAPHTTLQQVLDAQFAPDLWQRGVGILITHDGSAGDYAQVPRIKAAKLGDHLLGQAVAEVIFGGIAGEVGKGQHGQHDSLRRRMGWSVGA